MDYTIDDTTHFLPAFALPIAYRKRGRLEACAAAHEDASRETAHLLRCVGGQTR
jgi:hypothetical protein